MLDLILMRDAQTPDGTFGTLALPGYALFTLEEDWRDNAKGRSCIPAGTYTLVRTIYYKHGYETFEVTGVPGRSRILIHPGNTEEDTEGCVLVGLRIGQVQVPDEDAPGKPLTMKRAVVASREAFRRLMETLADVDEATLTVRWAAGLPKED